MGRDEVGEGEEITLHIFGHAVNTNKTAAGCHSVRCKVCAVVCYQLITFYSIWLNTINDGNRTGWLIDLYYFRACNSRLNNNYIILSHNDFMRKKNMYYFEGYGIT